MARANLNISPQIDEEFLRAQETHTVRILSVSIEAENLVLSGTVDKLSTAANDFDTILLDYIKEDSASFILFNLSDDVNASQTWLMITWIPDGCRVRDKMLYSSSREDLKKHIGIGLFHSEYAANYKTDITWAAYQSSLKKDVDMDVLTENERLIMEERVLSQVESSTVKSTALGVMPFEMSTEVMEKLDQFKEASGNEESDGCNWVEMTVESETVQLKQARFVSVGDSLQDYIPNDSASFIAIKLPKLGSNNEIITIFVFSCPENTPVRTKMTMSSSKASVLAAAQSKGLVFDKTLEIRDPEDIDEMVRAEIDPQSSAAASASSAGSQQANLNHSKPSRPGRGRAKVSKFKLDS